MNYAILSHFQNMEDYQACCTPMIFLGKVLLLYKSYSGERHEYHGFFSVKCVFLTISLSLFQTKKIDK
jgi:hypothetical protein